MPDARRIPGPDDVVWWCAMRDARTERGLTVAQVASACAIAEDRITAIEAGKEPYLSEACRLAAYFGVRIFDAWSPLSHQERQHANANALADAVRSQMRGYTAASCN